MKKFHHSQILKLNRSWVPIGTCSWKTAITKLYSQNETCFPVNFHISYDAGRRIVSGADITRCMESWVRRFDPSKVDLEDVDYVQTPHGPFALPKAIICNDFNKLPRTRVRFPTKRNIFARDNFTCGYTGVKLSKDRLSVDHIIPRSKGGEDTWENLITADKEVNRQKRNLDLSEFTKESGLKLLWRPTKPKDGLQFDMFSDEWKYIIGE